MLNGSMASFGVNLECLRGVKGGFKEVGCLAELRPGSVLLLADHRDLGPACWQPTPSAQMSSNQAKHLSSTTSGHLVAR